MRSKKKKKLINVLNFKFRNSWFLRKKKKEKKICVNCVHVSRELGKVMERRWLLFYLEVMSHTDHFSFTVHVYHESALSSAILNTMKMIYEREKFSGIFHSRSGPIIYETLIIISKRSPRNDNPTKLVPTDFVSTISKVGFKASMNPQISWYTSFRCFDRSLRLLGTDRKRDDLLILNFNNEKIITYFERDATLSWTTEE